MRVITGEARGKRLITLGGEEITRPTTEMVKEAMFSIIQFELAGANVLDLFAGSGQLGIEAISRGAQSCTFVDSSAEAIKITRSNVSACGFDDRAKILCSDSERYLRTAKKGFDIALLDPPYRQGTLERILPQLADIMSDSGATVICEHEKGLELGDEYGSLKKYRCYKYGKIALTVFKAPREDDEE